VVFFDIDGTLLRRSGPHHRLALEAAAVQVTGLRATTANVPVHGMLDRKILELMLLETGMPAWEIEAAMPRLVEEAQRVYVRESPGTLRHRVCPGVRAALERLRISGIPMGLVTGNLSRIGWGKMQKAGLRRYFSFGAFAEEAEDRTGLVRRALTLARQRGWIGRRTRVWHIGDHQNDILAARANGVRSLAVATGLSPAGELRAFVPDRLLRDLRSLRVEMLIS
jgi:phosphoglycolate phosphatase-like HAD superfamily hydrolase